MRIDIIQLIKITQLFMLFALLLKTVYTDIKLHKAFNKYILPFFIIGTLIKIAELVLCKSDCKIFFFNLLITAIVSILLYCFRIWAAGDAKMLITISMLIPNEYYITSFSKVFPGFFLLSFTFTSALIFITLESLFWLVCDFIRKEIKIKDVFPNISFTAMFSWITTYFSVRVVDEYLYYFNIIKTENAILITILVNTLLVVFVFSTFNTKVRKATLLLMGIIAHILFCIIHHRYCHVVSIQLLVTTVAIVLLRHITIKYNYKTIKTQDVEEGQILSRGTILLMMNSNIKGLPRFSDETTRCRLNKEEIKAINRWKKSKCGKEEIVIVRMIPFVPFMLMSTIIYLILSFVLRGDNIG